MRKRLVVLTGGIASGKTFCSAYLAGLNANIIDTDVIARALLSVDSNLYSVEAIEQVRSSCGGDVFEGDRLNRRLLRQKVFENVQVKKALEDIMHPLIFNVVLSLLDGSDGKYNLIVVPLLSRQSQYLEFADEILVAEINQSLQLNRVMKRDNISNELAIKIIQSQPTNQERRLLANTIIINTNKAHTQNILKQLDKKYSLAPSLSVVK